MVQTIKTIGIFGDTPTASTGMAVVLSNLAAELTKYFRVIYFGRFGQEKEFAERTTILPGFRFEYVPCQGGVWDRELVVRILKQYKVDYVFCEDDWYSASGIIGACEFWEIPFHFLTPIDSLPINSNAKTVFTLCDKVYVPNRSFQQINGMKRLNIGTDSVRKRQGKTIKGVYLPHGVDTTIFKPKHVEREPEFTFMWTGRIEHRKNPRAFLKAIQIVSEKADVRGYMRANWDTPHAERVTDWIIKNDLPITFDIMKDIPHHELVDVINKGDVNVCTSMAGGFEMGVTESGACRVPSLVTDWTFMNDNVINGKSGWLIPVDGFTYPKQTGLAELANNRIWGNISVNALADRMYWCYLNQEQVKHMGSWAQQWVTKNFNWKDIAFKLKEEILY